MVKTIKKILLSRPVGVVVIFLGHLILLHWLAATDTVAVLFAAGNHIPTGSLLLAIIFLVLRCLAILVLPGLLVAALGISLVRRWNRRTAEYAKESGLPSTDRRRSNNPVPPGSRGDPVS